MIHRFGDFELDEERDTLRRVAPDGERSAPIELQRKVMQVLVELARNGDRALTREQLVEAVWGDVAVTESSLTRCIGLARRALGDEAGTVIKTMRGRGYALGVPVSSVAEPEPAETDPAPAAQRGRRPRGMRLAAGTIALVALLAWLGRPFDAAAPASPAPLRASDRDAAAVAVLPFTDLRAGGSRSRQADGVAIEVNAQLAQWPELMVISPRSSFRFDPDAPFDPPAIGEALGVGTIVLGSIRARADDGAEVHVEAVDAASGFQLWSESFPLDGSLENARALADRVAGALGARVTLDPRYPRAPDADALDWFLRGNEAVRGADRHRLLEAVETYERALELDPELQRAYVALAEVYLLLWERAGEMQRAIGAANWIDFADQTAREALRRVPGDPDALTSLGQVHLARHQWRRAEAVFARALEGAAPARSSRRMAALLMMTGRIDEAGAHIERALRLDPLGIDTLRTAGRWHLYRGDAEQAAWYLQRVLELEPTALYSPRLLAAAYQELGQRDAARGDDPPHPALLGPPGCARRRPAGGNPREPRPAPAPRRAPVDVPLPARCPRLGPGLGLDRGPGAHPRVPAGGRRPSPLVRPGRARPAPLPRGPGVRGDPGVRRAAGRASRGPRSSRSGLLRRPERAHPPPERSCDGDPLPIRRPRRAGVSVRQSRGTSANAPEDPTMRFRPDRKPFRRAALLFALGCALLLLGVGAHATDSTQVPRRPIVTQPQPAPPTTVDCGDANSRSTCIECGTGGIVACCWDPKACTVVPDPNAPTTIPSWPGLPTLPGHTL